MSFAIFCCASFTPFPQPASRTACFRARPDDLHGRPCQRDRFGHRASNFNVCCEPLVFLRARRIQSRGTSPRSHERFNASCEVLVSCDSCDNCDASETVAPIAKRYFAARSDCTAAECLSSGTWVRIKKIFSARIFLEDFGFLRFDFPPEIWY